MAKMNPYDRQHLQNLSMYQRMIDAIYAKAAEEAAKIAASVRNIDSDKAFKFSNYPQTRKEVDNLMKSLQSRIEVTIVNGINAEWTLANNKNNELANRVFGDKVKSLSKAEERRYYSTNDNARQAFQQRKINGLSLSDRVWKYTDQFKEEIELGLDVGIRNGVAADKMAGELKQYLRFPNKLFRRVRDERGQLHLSQAAKAFHPGRGVYRSSFMNARRLAATETNMAYRTSDFMRWQKMDFVVGIEIQLSNNHTCKGSDGKPHEFHDICDELKGRYPKDFKFTSWHPHCRCRAISILKTQKEIAEDTKKILNGEKPDTPSVNEVKDVPEGFKKYVQNNAARIVSSQQLPYFMTDNPKYVGEAFTEAQPSTRIAASMAKSGVFDYVEEYKNRNPKIAALYNELDDNSPRTDIERAMLLNQIKQECAKMTQNDLQAWGVIDDTMTLSRFQRDYEITGNVFYYDKNGQPQQIKAQYRDMLVFKDAYGKEFAYPVGIKKTAIGLSAKEASEVINNYPPYLKKGIERVSFFGEENPLDPYWKWKYNNPNHFSAATDGGKTSFWIKVSKDDFKGYMTHEAAHIIDGDYKKISSSDDWKKAVEADINLWKLQGGKESWGYVSKYAMTNHAEDFAESLREYINNHDWFKKSYPNRAVYIRKLAKQLSK